jgi:hypothetical protein
MNPNNPDDIKKNFAIRQFVLQNAQPIVMKVGSYTQQTAPFVSGQATTINIQPIPVGLITKFTLVITANVAQAAAETLTRTTLGGANFLSQVVVTDYNNLTRHNTAGWHLDKIATARRATIFGQAYTTDTTNGYGAQYNICSAPASITTVQTMYQVYEIPLAYSDTDLRGAMFANLTGASGANISLTINPNFIIPSTGNPTFAGYISSTSGNRGQITSYTIDVYQHTLDQLVQSAPGQYVLPDLDLAANYQLLNTTQTGLSVSQDYTLQLAALRQFYSHFIVYDNAGVLNAGTDLNYISLTSANTMQFFKLPPTMLQLLFGRQIIGDDWPKGVYYLPSRMKPISTLNSGNVAFNVNPSAVTAGAQLLVGSESFVMTQQLNAVSSLAAT